MLHQHAVPRGMVRNDIDDDLQPACMRLTHESLQIVSSAVIRINPVIVTHRIRTSNRSLLLLLPDRMDRHHPEDRHPEILELIQPRRYCIKVTLLRKRTWIDLINHTIAHPITYRPSRLFRNIATRLLRRKRRTTGEYQENRE